MPAPLNKLSSCMTFWILYPQFAECRISMGMMAIQWAVSGSTQSSNSQQSTSFWTCGICHGTTSPPSFSVSFLFCPLPLPSFTYFQLHLTPSAHLPPPLHQLQSLPAQLCYVH